MLYRIDIDGTICEETNGEYHFAKPWPDAIAKVNALHDAGHQVIYWTARGATTGIDWQDFTENQLKAWGCRFDAVECNKPHYDKMICDKAEFPEWVSPRI